MKWEKYIKTSCIAIISSIFFSLISILPASAATDALIMSCPPSVNTSATFECKITGTSGSPVNSINASVSASNFQIVSFTADTAWNGNLSGTALSLTSTSDLNGSFSVGTLTLRANASGGVGAASIESVIFASSNSESTANGQKLSIEIIAQETPIIQNKTEENTTGNTTNTSGNTTNTSSNNTTIIDTSLSSLEISGHDINFSPTTYTYTISLNDGETKLSIVASSSDPDASIKITGNEDLTDGSVVRVSVSKGDNLSTYRIKIASDIAPISNNTSGGTTGNKSNFNPMILIIIIGGVLIIGAVVAFIIIRKKKSSDPFTSSSSTVSPLTVSGVAPSTPTPNPFLSSEPAPAPAAPAGPAETVPQPSNPFIEPSAPAAAENPCLSGNTNNPFLEPSQPSTPAPEPPAFAFQTPPSLPTAPTFSTPTPETPFSPVTAPEASTTPKTPAQTNYQSAMPAPTINPQGSPISLKDLPFDNASSESPAVFES